MPSVTVIDGSGFIYRAFHALPPLNTPQGHPIGAVAGFISMILKWRDAHHPQYGVVVFDLGRSVSRQQLFPSYKSHRAPTPPELSSQFPLIKEFCGVMGLATLEKEGVEADDIIASVTHRMIELGWHVDIVTSDKDLCQLSQPDVILHDPLKKRSLNQQEVENLWGVKPQQIIDVQALAGDSSDGIPGIPGIGIKTATAWIQQFGSLEGVIENADTLPTVKKQDLVKAYADQARLCYQLAQLQTHHWQDIWIPERHWIWPVQGNAEKVVPWLDQHQLTVIKQRLLNSGWLKTDTAIDPPSQTQDLLSSADPTKEREVQALSSPLLYHAPDAAIDILCSAPAVAIYPHHDDIYVYWSPHHWTKGLTASQWQKLWQEDGCTKIAHDLKSLRHLKEFQSMQSGAVWDDIMLLSYVLHGHTVDHGLKALLAPAVLSDLEPQQIAALMYTIWGQYVSDVDRHQLAQIYYTIDRPLIPVLYAMETQGVALNVPGLYALEKDMVVQCQELLHHIIQMSGQDFNPASPKQLGHVLFDCLGWPKSKKSSKTGSYVVNSDVLSSLARQGYELAHVLLEWRQLTKLLTTYVNGLKEHVNPLTQRIHATFNMTVTSTGRLSSQDPNVQNIPIRTVRGRALRRLFVAPEGFVFLSLDYAQIELCLLAHMGPVASLQRAFAQQVDIHAQTAVDLFGVSLDHVSVEMRRQAKTINFGILYGMSAFGLAQHLNMSRAQAQSLIEKYFATYPEVQSYIHRTQEQAMQYGYVRTWWGRKCWIPGATHAHAVVRAAAARQAVNAPLQGTSADIIKKAMVLVHQWIQNNPWNVSLVLQIHDELIFQVACADLDNVTEPLRHLMQTAAGDAIPLRVNAIWGPTLDFESDNNDTNTSNETRQVI